MVESYQNLPTINAGNVLVKDKINEITRLLYARMGYQRKQGFDFETSQHPQEQMCFDMACLAWEEITGDSPDLYSDFSTDSEEADSLSLNC
jgi:hypothetical protein